MRQFEVPSWLIETSKIAAGAALAACTLYIRIARIEDHQVASDSKFNELRAQVEARAEVASNARDRIAGLEITSKLVEKNITESLSRIEADIRDVKADVKELHRTTQAK